MIRLTIFLLAGIGLAMYFADSFPQPMEKSVTVTVLDPSPVESPVESPIVKPEKEIRAKLVILEKTPALTSPSPKKPAQKEVVAVKPIDAPSYLDLFQSPAEVGSDGTLKIAAIQPETTTVVSPIPESIEIQLEEPTNVWFVSGERVNVRQGPTTSAEVVDQVNYAEAVEVLTEPDNGWVLIRIEGDGVEGYMANRFLQAIDPHG